MRLSIEREFLKAELAHGPVDLGPRPVLAALGTIAETALSNPLLREPLEIAGLAPRMYLPFKIPEELLSSTEWQMALVISPHKQSVASSCTALAQAAAATGVVDTLVRAESQLVGLNTNAYAAAAALQHLITGAAAERLVLVGTGASARSVAYAVTRWFPSVHVGVYGRSAGRALGLVDEIASMRFRQVDRPIEFRPDVIVNATTVGEIDDSVTLGPDVQAALQAGVRVFDLTNRLSALQSTALGRGCIVLSGNLMQRITNRLRVSALRAYRAAGALT
jgi:shikimate dehydrogenase